MSFWGNRKPPFGTRIDRGHPLAVDLRAFIMLPDGGVGYDVVRDVMGTATVFPAVNEHGQCLQGSVAKFIPDAQVNINAPCSWMMIGSLSANTSFARGLNNELVGVNGGYGLGMDSSGTYMRAFVTATFVPAVSSVPAVVNKVHTWHGRYTGAAVTISQDGVQTGSAAATAVGVGGNLHIGSRAYDDNFQWTGTINMGAVWARALSLEEVAWLHAEPYAMFEPQNLEVFYSIPAGVTFNPAWAMNSNQVLYV